jgi:CRISPR-associated protein Csy2
MDKLLELRHLQVEGANAIAGMTWGFPAVTSFLGFVHALQRKVHERISDSILLESCAVICHSSQVQSYSDNMSRESYFALTRNPLVLKGKEAVTAPFNEEGKMRMDITLLISIKARGGYISPDDIEDFEEYITQVVPQMRIAGGVITSMGAVKVEGAIEAINSDVSRRKRYLRKFLPGFALVCRQDVLEQHSKDTEQTPFDAWLDFSARKMRAHGTDEQAEWVIDRPDFSGWLKPIMIGYQGVSDLYPAGAVGHVRDRDVPVQFVEAIYSLGQWISPHRIDDIQHLLWSHSHNAETSLYVCRNDYEPGTPLTLETNVSVNS